MKRTAWAAVLLALLMWIPCALAAQEEAADLTAECSFSATSKSNLIRLRDGHCRTGYQASAKKECYVQLHSDVPMHHLYVQWWGLPSGPWILQTLQDGEWTDKAVCGQHGFVQEYIALDGETDIRITARPPEGKNKASLKLHEVTVWGEGKLPDSVHVWQAVEKADMLVLSAHPDDEHIFLGGLLPTYAAERGMDVQVAYLTYGSISRIEELLNGLWTAGVRIHPVLVQREDKKTTSLKRAYHYWDRDELCEWLVGLVRKYRPNVMVTHDVDGEYGHGAHMAAADVAMFAYDHSGDSAYLPESGEAWQMDKLYLHLYETNQQKLDWNAPLSFFGGKTGLEVAADAFACHVSQQGQKFKDAEGRVFVCEVIDGGWYDNAVFGLYGSQVGPDVIGGDLFENVVR